MTRDEVKSIVRAVCAAYPNFKPDNIAETVDAWYLFLGDQDYKQIIMALKTYVNTSNTGFAPSVSQLIQMTHKVEELTDMTDAQAWSLVAKALRNGTYHSKEEFERLPERVQKAVGSPEQLRNWAIDEDFNETVVMSLFQRNYRTVVERERQLVLMPVELRIEVNKALGIESHE